MEKLLYRIVPWVIILLPLPVLGLAYASLPADVLIYRNFDGTGDYAAKSVFTVFRVPMIEIVCGLAIEVMRRRASGLSYARAYYMMWTILLWTVAVKTFLQTLEFIAPGHRSEQFFYVTAGVVVLGIISAAFVGRNAFSGYKRDEWKLRTWEKAALAGLLVSYLFLAFAQGALV